MSWAYGEAGENAGIGCRMASSQTTPRKALEFYARTVVSGVNGGGRMASARKIEDYGGGAEEGEVRR